jgi:signal transduction histidine kinase
LTESDRQRLVAVFSSESACFSDLAIGAGLDPATDFRFSELAGVNFSGSDLSGFNFSGANLSNTCWLGAIWDDTTIMKEANLDGAVGLKGYEKRERESSLVFQELQTAIDYLDQAPAGFFSVDSTGELCYLNATLCDWLDLNPTEIRDGRKLTDIMSSEDARKLLRTFDDYADKAKTYLLDVNLFGRRRRKIAVQLRHEIPRTLNAPQRSRTLVIPRAGDAQADELSKVGSTTSTLDALVRAQQETLDNLSDAVALFASNGRLRVTNPAFAKMWNLSSSVLDNSPHLDTVIELCSVLADGVEPWNALRKAVLESSIESVIGQFECNDGRVLDFSIVTLADGACLLTFRDVSDEANVERGLRERNEALETADQLKMDFVHHVSYELREPLTTIVGFTHLMDTESLTDKQREYVGHITSSANALLAIINDILDLSTVDAGAMKLDLGPVDIGRTLDAVAEGIKDRLLRNSITLDIVAAPNIGSFVAEERRIRQVLFNLLANAASFSPTGATVTLTAERKPDAIVFSIADRGPGIPSDVKDRVFDWFETQSSGGTSHRGVGLGLSIVRSLVELHGGAIKIDSIVGGGTKVTCIFPLQPGSAALAVG